MITPHYYIDICRAFSMIVSKPCNMSKSFIEQYTSGSMPFSVDMPSASYIGHAENLTPQPFGSSLENGSPAPPPVLSPMTTALGHRFIYFTNSFAAENTPRLVSTKTGFCQRIYELGSIYCSCSLEKSLCPRPVLCCI